MNSFFSFPALFIAIPAILTILLLLERKKRLHHAGVSLLLAHIMILAFIAAATLITAQFITLPLALFFSLIPSLFLSEQLTQLKGKEFAFFITFLHLVISLFFISYYTGDGNAFTHINQFDSIFYGPTLVYDNPLVPLKNLNIPDKMLIFARHPYISPDAILNPSFEVQQIAQDDSILSISKFDILKEYISSWKVASRSIEMIANNFIHFHSASHGNFSVPVIPPDRPYIPWWDFYRIRIFLGTLFSPIVLGIFFVIHGVLIGYMTFFSKFKHTPLLIITLFLYLFSISQVLVCLLGEGFFGLGRHLLPGAYTYDLSLIFSLIVLLKLHQNKASKYLDKLGAVEVLTQGRIPK